MTSSVPPVAKLRPTDDNVVTVLVLCIFYSAIQLPTHTPKSNNGLLYNTTDFDPYDFTTVFGDFFTTESLIFYLTVITTCLFFPLFMACRHARLWLALGAVLSVSRFITPDDHMAPTLYMAAVVGDGMGYTMLYLTFTLLVRRHTPYSKIPRNFGLFAAVYGTTYILFGAALVFTKIPPFHSVFRVFSAISFGVGVVFGGTVLCCSYAWGDDSEGGVRRLLIRTLHIHQTIPSALKVALVLPVVFYGLTTSFLAKLYCVCASATETYHSDSMVTFGAGFMLSCMQWSYTYKRWHNTPRSAISIATLIVGMILLRKSTRDLCTGALTSLDDGQWYLWPSASLLLGVGLGTINCEVYTITSIVWDTHFRFALVLIIQCLWGITFTYVFPSFTVTHHLAGFITLAVMYICVVGYVHHRMRVFMGRLVLYRNELKAARRTYGTAPTCTCKPALVAPAVLYNG